MSDHHEQEELDGVAVIGMACRFPGAKDVAAFWRNLRDGVESITFFEEDVLRQAGVDENLLSDPRYVKANPIVEGVELFDPEFFGMNPGVAQITDPQQRLFLQLAWHSLENAGYDASRYDGDIGVFGGLSINTYLLENFAGNREFIEGFGMLQAAMANRGDHLATLTAYKLGLRGPAFVVQSTCSTALSSVHLACLNLINYQTDMALAGGVAVRVPQQAGYLFQEGGVNSPDGHCRPFDALAEGTVFGGGGGVVVLKRLEDAISDGDHIYGVILSSAANNDGDNKIGYTAPALEGQRKVIAMAHAIAGTEPESISYVECHGTGTPLGDPIEVEALRKVFGSKPGVSCALGSVKSNIGHLDTAAGIAGLIKTLLCLQHKSLVPTLHYQQPNPKIDFENSPFYVNTAFTPWEPSPGFPRRAGVSAFGIGGTNVHVILEEAPTPQEEKWQDAWLVLPFSAKGQTELAQLNDQLVDWFKANPDKDPARVAHTLQMGRKQFTYRRVVVCRGYQDALTTLEKLPTDRAFYKRCESNTRQLAFVFAGLGEQRMGMCRNLYADQPGFRKHADACISLLAPILGLDLKTLVFSETENREAVSASLAEVILFIIEVALAKSWMDLGVTPDTVTGEGIGMVTAAFIAGAMTLEEAATLIAARRETLERQSSGSMLMVSAGESLLGPLLESHPGVAQATVYRSALCALSGPPEMIDRLAGALTDFGVAWRPLQSDRALQNPSLASSSDRLCDTVSTIHFKPTEITLISNIDGKPLESNALTPAFWCDQLTRTQRLDQAFETLFKAPERIILEIGPGRTLTHAARLHPKRLPGHTLLSSMDHEAEADAESRWFAATLGRLWLNGVDIAWEKQWSDERPRRVPLPGYPFKQQRLWIDPPNKATEDLPARRAHITDWFYTPTWKRTPPLTSQTKVKGTVLFFTDTHGLGDLVASALASQGAHVIRVSHGESFQNDGKTIRINPSAPEDYKSLLKRIESESEPLSHIVHAWSLETYRTHGSREPLLARTQTLGLQSLFFLAQALGASGLKQMIQISILVDGVFEVTGTERLQPEKALVEGARTVIPQEYPNIRTTIVDIQAPEPGDPFELHLAERLAMEVIETKRDTVIAFRGAHRWVRGFEPVPIEADTTTPLRQSGVYAITGGMGGMGLAIAEFLAKSYRAKLVLIGRTPLSPRENWDTRIDARERDKINAIRRMENHGAEVLTLALDVADHSAMQEAATQIKQRFGVLDGLIHAAGIPAGGVIQRKTASMAEHVMSPKVKGTLLLDELLEPSSFVLYCGSRTAIMGGVGHADYAAANAFLDAYAHYRNSIGKTRTLTLDWCSWKEVGMLAETAKNFSRTSSQASPAPTTGPITNIGHPILQRKVGDDPQRAVYLSDLRVDTHWLLADHRIMGTPVIAGTSYIEMVRAVFDDQLTDKDLEIANIFFLMPLKVEENESRVVRIVLEPMGEGYSFRVTSAENAQAGHWRDHVTGNVKPIPRSPDTHIDLNAVKARCNLDRKVFTDADATDEDHGPRWQVLKEVRWGRDEVLTTIELPLEFAGDLDRMKIHPSMLDKSIGTGRDFILGEIPFMPYSYKRLVYKNPFRRRIHVHTRVNDPEVRESETPTFNLTLADDDGRVLVEIDSFALKRVDNVGGLFKTLAAESEVIDSSIKTNDGANIFQQILEAEGITPAEGVEVFRRALAAPAVSQLVVSTRDFEKMLSGPAINVPEQKAETGTEQDTGPVRPKRPRPDLENDHVQAETDTQEKLVAIWQRALGVEPVGIEDNFMELGGDSVVAIEIVSMVNKQLGLELAMGQLFEAPTVARLAALIDQAQSHEAGEMEPLEDGGRMGRGARRRAKAQARRGIEK